MAYNIVIKAVAPTVAVQPEVGGEPNGELARLDGIEVILDRSVGAGGAQILQIPFGDNDDLRDEWAAGTATTELAAAVAAAVADLDILDTQISPAQRGYAGSSVAVSE